MKLARTKAVSTLAAALTVAACALMLTGCAGGLDKVDACKDVMTKLVSISDNIQQSSSEITKDPEKASAKISSLSQAFSKTAQGLKQEDVKKAAIKASDSFQKFSDEFQNIAKDPTSADTSKIASLSTDMSKNFSALKDVCTGK